MADEIEFGKLSAVIELAKGDLDAELATAKAALANVGKQIQQLQVAFQAGGMEINAFEGTLETLMETQSRLQASLGKTEAELVQVVAKQQQFAVAGLAFGKATAAAGKSMTAAGDGAKNMHDRTGQLGQGLTQLGYLADDLQYGFRGVANNLQPVTTSILAAGGAATATAAAWGAGVAIVGIGVYELYTHWDQLMDLVGTGKVRTEAEQMEELGKKTGKTADETARLNKYKREEADIAEMLAKRPKGEREAEEARQTAIVEADSEKVKAGITKTLIATGRGEKMTPAEAAEIAQIEKFKAEVEPGSNMAKGYEKILEESRAKIQARINEANAKLTEEYLKPKNLDTLIKLVGANPAAFPAGILKDLEDLKPENRKQQAIWEAEGLSNEQRAEEKVAREKVNKMLTKEGQKNDPTLAGNMSAGDKDIANILTRQGQVNEIWGQEEQQRHNKKWDADQKVAQEKLHRETLQTAREEMPGIEKMAEAFLLESKVRESMGLKGGNLEEAITEKLIAGGMDEPEAKMAAGDLGVEVRRKLGERVTNAMIGEREQPIGRSEQFHSAAELAAKVQAGVGQDNEQKKHTSQFDKMIDHLAKLANQRGINVSYEIQQ